MFNKQNISRAALACIIFISAVAHGTDKEGEQHHMMGHGHHMMTDEQLYSRVHLTGMPHGDGYHGWGGSAVGQPADNTQVTNTIYVSTLDSMRFQFASQPEIKKVTS